MPLGRIRDPFSHPEWLFEVKWDGFRSLAYVQKGVCRACSWTPEESQAESCEHQDNANIHCQPFPESVSEEHEIYTDYDGCHRHRVKHDRYLSAHFSSVSPRKNRSSPIKPTKPRLIDRTGTSDGEIPSAFCNTEPCPPHDLP